MLEQRHRDPAGRPEGRPLAAATAVILALGLLALSCGRVTSDALVFRNFTLIDGGDHAPISNAAMVVEKGRVAWVGPAADLNAPSGARTTDLNGAFVIPGLIDLHTHLGNTIDLVQDSKYHTRASVEKDLKTYASYGVTAVLSMGTDQDTIFPIRSEQRAAFAKTAADKAADKSPTDGLMSMARLYTTGQGLMFKGGYGGLAGVNQPVASPEEAAAAVNAQLDKGVDFIKLWMDDELGTMPKMPPDIARAIIEAAHKRSVRVLGHIFYLDDAKLLAAQGIDGFVHSVRDQPIDQALIDSMEAHGTWQTAGTLSREASMFAYGSTPPFANDAFFTRGVSGKTLELIKSAERQKTIASNPNFKKYPAFFETAKANFKRQVDAGVQFAAGTDSGPPGRFPGYFLHWELQLMVDAGLTPAQAIDAATRRAAIFLGAEDLGTLEPTKWADFVVLDANPLADIKNSRKIRAVYIAGSETPSINQTQTSTSE